MAEFWNLLAPEEKFYIIVLIALVVIVIAGLLASLSVNMTFKKYSDVSSSSGMSAFKVARKMLDDNGLQHVAINRCEGNLTDHYDPRNDTVSLSDTVYNSNSIAAIGVACHEVGHAIQHNNNYAFAKIRSALVPVVNIVNRMYMPIILVGILLGFFVYNPLIGNLIVYAGLILFGASTLFTFVTLPTEFNASSRALKSIRDSKAYTNKEASQAKKVLSAAALTYVVAFLMSLLQFLRFLAILLMKTRRRR